MTQPTSLTNRTAAIFVALLVAVVAFLGWAGDRRSCERQSGVRDGTRLLAATAAAKAWQSSLSETGVTYAATVKRAKDYERAAREARPLQCSGLLPDTR